LCLIFIRSLQRTCFIYRQATIPSGIIPLEDSVGVTYYEKFCLPAEAPLKCSEASFRRYDQKILVGFAQNVTVESTLEACAAACIRQLPWCKSALYFYDGGECITNSATGDEEPTVFIDEGVDNVVYFDNACAGEPLLPPSLLRERSLRRQAVKSRSRNQSRPVRSEFRDVPSQSITNQVLSHAKLSEGQGGDSNSAWGEWSLCDSPKGRRMRERQCLPSEANCDGSFVQVQWCEDLPESERHVKPIPARVLGKPETSSHRAVPVNAALVQHNPISAFSGDAFAPWAPECEDFAVAQECIDGQRLGFERNKCIGVPCPGPAFRYCFLRC
jgi:hypothetical protein